MSVSTQDMANDTAAAQVPQITEAPTETSVAEPQQQLDPQAQHDQLAALLANPDWTPEKPAEPVVAEVTTTEEPPVGETSTEPEAVAAPVSEAAPAVTDPNDEDEDEPEPEIPDKGKRFRFTDPADRQFAALRKEGVAPDEAARIAYGLGKQAEAPAVETQATDELVVLQAELAEVDKKLSESGAEEGLTNSDIVTLTRRQSELLADIRAETRLRQRDAENAQKAAQNAAAARETQQQQQAAEVTKLFPALANPASPLRIEADRLFAEYQGSALMTKADAPAKLARMAATNVAEANSAANGTSFEVEFAKLKAAAPAPKAPVVAAPVVPAKVIPKPKPVTVASGAQVTQRPDKPATEEDKFKDAQTSLDPRAQHEALNRLLYGT